MIILYALVIGLAGSADENTALLSFYSESCGPCRQMGPIVQRLADAGHPIRRIEVSRDPATAARFGVSAVPCFVMLVNGREVARQVGMASQSQLEHMLALARGASGGAPFDGPATPSSSGGSLPAVRSAPALADLLGRSGNGRDPGTSPAPLPGWRIANPDRPPPSTEKLPEAELLAATVRIRVQHAAGQSCGSGTLIDARRGEALVLTCGHLFRESQGKGRIEVDIFAPHAQENVPGTLVHFDTECDLGLVSIRPGGPVRAARVAPPHYCPLKGARVYSAGCDGGAPPTVRAGVITALDRFLGPPNLTATGLPLKGRSGGGLFSAEGLLIGVCNAALPEEKEGFYAALGAIHKELDRAGLAFVYREPSEPPLSPGPMVAVNPPSMPKEMPPPQEMVQPTDLVRSEPAGPFGPATRRGSPMVPASTAAALQSQDLSPEEKATLDEIHRRRAEGAEVICIIRQKDKPDAPSEIVVLDRASAEFLQRLQAAADAARPPTGIAGNTLPPPRATTMEPATAIASAHPTQNAAQGTDPATPPDLPEWKPRWLQPGYQGQ